MGQVALSPKKTNDRRGGKHLSGVSGILVPMSGDATEEQGYDNSWPALLEFAEREAGRQTTDSLLAEEVAATVIKKLVIREADIAPEARRAWLRTAVRNELIDLRRRAHVGSNEPRHIALPDDAAVQAKREGSRRRWLANSPSSEAIWRERERRVESVAGHVLSRLNDRQRELILLSMDESLTHEQIAEALGYANADVVKTTLNRLRKRLRDEFGADIENVLREW